MSFNTALDRIPVTVIEIDQDQCTLDYGTAPCTAAIGVTGTDKCFNTYASCQDQANYNKGTLTLKFTKPQSDIPEGEYLIPCVKGVSTSPTKINVGARSGSEKPLGRRAQITINMIDFPHSDNLVDKYVTERTYDPLANGTFWGKWLKRNPYYNGRALRVKEGYFGQTLAEMQTRHFVIESISLPDSTGKVVIKAQDILRLADDDKAQAPLLSNGKLLTDINATDTSLIITGGSQSEYEQNNTKKVRIGDEIIAYTGLSVGGNGDITLSGLTRGSDNTEAATHEIDDKVQGCLEYSNIRPDLIALDLLENYGNIQNSFIDTAGWTSQADLWLSSIYGSRLLSEPIGVTELLGELCEQFLFYVWWDEVNQLVKMKVVAPEFGTIPLIDEENNLIQNKTALTSDTSQRVSEVWTSYTIKSPVSDKDKRESYRKTLARIDATASSANEYNERKVYEILSPWLTDNNQVSLLTSRVLSRYRDNPVTLKFALDAKDRGLSIGDVFDINFKSMVDFTGQPETGRYQVVSAHESVAGELIQYEAIRFDFGIDFKPAFWMVDNAPIYTDATEEELKSGGWWVDTNGKIGQDEGYVWS